MKLLLSLKKGSIQNLDVVTLEKHQKFCKICFYIYLVVAVIILAIGCLLGSELINIFSSITDSIVFKILLLFSVFGFLNFIMIFFLWFIIETSYYKNLEVQNGIMIYLKNKHGELKNENTKDL